MVKHEPPFRGIWIPKEVWLNEDFSLLQKALYVEIDSLSNEEGCLTSNKYFSEFFNCSELSVTKTIKGLKDLGIITTKNTVDRKTFYSINKFIFQN